MRPQMCRSSARQGRWKGTRYPVNGSLAYAAMEMPESTIVLNADDWGAHALTTDRIRECVLAGVVSSVSAMVFMEDSERAAEISGRDSVDTGLHLNLTMEFSAPGSSSRLIEHHRRIRRFLQRRYCTAIYHPGLAGSFEYVVKAQLEEFERLFGYAPRRIDGHHHMHQCANVLFGKLMPAGAIVRRNFTFWPGEKGLINRAYRKWCDAQLAKRYRLGDFFFNLMPMKPAGRLEKIFALGAAHNVEIETHPVNDEEYRFLMGPGFERFAGEVSVARGYILREFKPEGGVVAIA